MDSKDKLLVKIYIQHNAYGAIDYVQVKPAGP